MNARFARLLTLWIVPLLLARAFIPAGFMVAADAGGLSLVVCAGVASPPAVRHAAHASHHEIAQHPAHSIEHGDTTHADHGGRGLEHESAPCPFLLGATAALADIPRVASTASILSDPVLDFLSAPTFSVGPLRSERIRGPPFFA